VRVFIADDSKIILDRIRALISEIDGIEIVGEAVTGVQAIESVMQLRPEVVTLDIRMPEGNGISVLESIKKDNPDIIAVMLTNYPYPQYQEKCVAAGADFFLDKSSQFDEIPEILTGLLAGKGCGSCGRG